MRLKDYSLIFIAVPLNVLLWVVAAAMFPQEAPAAILHYSAVVGVDFIGSGHQIYVLPLIGLILLAGNVALGYMVREVSWRATRLLWATTIVIQAILIVSFGMLWMLNR